MNSPPNATANEPIIFFQPPSFGGVEVGVSDNVVRYSVYVAAGYVYGDPSAKVSVVAGLVMAKVCVPTVRIAAGIWAIGIVAANGADGSPLSPQVTPTAGTAAAPSTATVSAKPVA